MGDSKQDEVMNVHHDLYERGDCGVGRGFQERLNRMCLQMKET